MIRARRGRLEHRPEPARALPLRRGAAGGRRRGGARALVPGGPARRDLRQRDGRAHDARAVRLRDDAGAERRRARPARHEVLLDRQPVRRLGLGRRGGRPAATVVSVIVPADRAGVRLEDDWDGMGQRLTASGTSRFDGVHVARRRGAAQPDRRGLARAALGVPAALPRRGDGAGSRATPRATPPRSPAAGRARSATAPARSRRTTRCVQEAVGRIDADAFAGRVGRARRGRRARRRAHGPRPRGAARGVAARGAGPGRRLPSWRPASAERLFDAGGASATEPRAQPRPPLAQRAHARLAQSRHVQGPRARRPARSTGSGCPPTASSERTKTGAAPRFT